MDFDARSDARYAAWSSRHLDLQRQKNDVAQQLEQAQKRHAAQRDPSVRHAAALALVEGREPDDASGTATEAEVKALMRRLDVLDEAVRLSAEREGQVVAEIVRDLKPAVRATYLDLLRRTIPVVLALGKLAEEEVAFRRGLEQGGISITSCIIAEPLRDALLAGPEQGSLGRWLDALRREYPGEVEGDA